ncbi:hypothetical protein Taro_016072 [Colocasia esculenta]|uniref:Uncharacterized protein n=1 Tax=Colocasia esculenta TaxID=4460 RepID=A0A843UJA7_COLES|nr:hypothetical protein [Colocasia esculenta]
MTPTVVTSPVGCPRFSVSQAVSSGLCPGTCVVLSRSVSSDLDTLTPLLELYVRQRERRQWDSGCCTCLLVTCSALVVGGTDTGSRHWSPASPFPVPHSSEPRPGSLEVPGMGLRPCGPQVVVFSWSPQLLDLFMWSGNWTFRSWLRDREVDLNLEWLIEEIGVVEEMIQRRALSV